jgi:hypothetical protein
LSCFKCGSFDGGAAVAALPLAAAAGFAAGLVGGGGPAQPAAKNATPVAQAMLANRWWLCALFDIFIPLIPASYLRQKETS